MNTYISFIDKDGINIDFDLNNISNDELKKIYIIQSSFKELSKYHKNKLGTLSKKLYEKQQLNYTIPVDEVTHELKMKYMLYDWQIETRTVCNKVKVILIIPNIKDNVDLLVDDMNKFGYYLSYYNDISNNEYNYQYLYFEPNYTDDVTNRVKRYGIIIHLTHGYNLENIIKDNKLIPKYGNRQMKYPDRIYFINGDLYKKYILDLARDLNNESNRKSNEYLEIRIDTDKLPNNIKFYVDPNYEMGIYTYDEIPFNCVYMIRKINLKTGEFIQIFPNKENNEINESIDYNRLLKGNNINTNIKQKELTKFYKEQEQLEYQYYLNLYKTLLEIQNNEVR